MNLTYEQENALKSFESSYSVYFAAKRELKAKLEAAMQEELGQLATLASARGNEAIALGVPMSKLGDKTRPGMQTASYHTIKNFLDITKDSFKAVSGADTVSHLDAYYTLLDGGLIHVSYQKPYGHKGLSGEATVKFMPYVDRDGVEQVSFNNAGQTTAPQLVRWLTTLSHEGQDGFYRDELSEWLAAKGFVGVAGAEALALGVDSVDVTEGVVDTF